MARLVVLIVKCDNIQLQPVVPYSEFVCGSLFGSMVGSSDTKLSIAFCTGTELVI